MCTDSYLFEQNIHILISTICLKWIHLKLQCSADKPLLCAPSCLTHFLSAKDLYMLKEHSLRIHLQNGQLIPILNKGRKKKKTQFTCIKEIMRSDVQNC